MKTTRLTLALLLVAACGDDDTNLDGGNVTSDGATADVAGEDAGDDAGDLDAGGPDVAIADGGTDANQADVYDAGPPACGSEQPSVADVSGTEGLAIATDGTIYYSQSGGIGRVLPGMAPDSDWITGLGSTMWGLAFRESDRVLFAATPAVGGGTIYRIDTTAEDASAESFVTGAGQPNGLILVDDGTLLYSDFGGGRVMHVDAGGATTLVAELPRPNGLLIDEDGTLLVLSYGSGAIQRITVDENWAELSREMAANTDTNPDGIGLDAMGRYYITDNGAGRLLRYDADFGAEEVLLTGVPSAANIAWGQGPLVCTELYVTSSGTLRVLDVGATGRP